ncbi:MAG: hypothetical protein EHJ95_06100 [Methanobacteriota archaeon]|nr:MAG: hypothetical protein EHJ95_06100 [Euryarchaeota archaeon]
MKGISPGYLAKLDEVQQKWAITGPGKMFLDDFVWKHGNHCFIIGITGAGGKTNKGYWMVNWLKHTETQIWMDSGKSDEIVPLLCQDIPVQIIVPKYSEVFIEERINGKWQPIEDHPIVTHIPDAGDAWWAIKKKHINILAFRNAFWTKEARALWMVEFFQTLADWSRLRTMPRIFPFSLHIDETQWTVSGQRITTDPTRTKASEAITENVLEIRSSGGRIIAYAQGFLNLPPAMRDNLVCTLLCCGANIDSSESKKLSPHCNPPPWVKRPANFRRNEGKFITEDGRASPTDRPWPFPLMPKKEEDRAWLKRCRVRYVGFNDQRPKEAETQEECFPELGRFSVLAIKPEISEVVESRWQAPREVEE